MTPVFYIHQHHCISPQPGVVETGDALSQPVDQILKVIEPVYDGIPPAILRRMSKSVRIGVGAALPLLLKWPLPDGIIIGTANAGMADCILFLKQIVDYKEGILTPASFIQSTPNALAAQLSMINHNHGYNMTHVHLGLAFENALTDAGMLISEHPDKTFLIGASDDISSYNHTINVLAGWFRSKGSETGGFYALNSSGSIAGEGAAMFMVSGNPDGALARVRAIYSVCSDDLDCVKTRLKFFLNSYTKSGEKIDMLLSGENGDCRMLKYYNGCEDVISDDATICRFKHLCGEYPTASAFALWLACEIIQKKKVPTYLIKKQGIQSYLRNILIYNNYKGTQHSFMLISA